MAEYKLSYTAEEVDTRLEAAGMAVRYDSDQGLNTFQRLQAMNNSSYISYPWYYLTSPAEKFYPSLYFTPSANESGTYDYYDVEAVLSLTDGHVGDYSCSPLYQVAYAFNMLSKNFRNSPLNYLVPIIIEGYELIASKGLISGSNMILSLGVGLDAHTNGPSCDGHIRRQTSPNPSYPEATHAIFFDYGGFGVCTGTILYDNVNGVVVDSKYRPMWTDTTLSTRGYVAEAKSVGDALSTKIATPETATVGQVLTVKAVDDNGKPTEWETTDAPAAAKIQNVITLTVSSSEPTPDNTIYTVFKCDKSFSELQDIVDSVESEILFELCFPSSENIVAQKCYVKAISRDTRVTSDAESGSETSLIFIGSTYKRYDANSGITPCELTVVCTKSGTFEQIRAVEYAEPQTAQPD